MTDEKILEVIARYEAITKAYTRVSNKGPIAHIATMIPKMKEFLLQGRREKLMRWLGFIQGTLWCEQIFTIEDLKMHNKPTRIDQNTIFTYRHDYPGKCPDCYEEWRFTIEIEIVNNGPSVKTNLASFTRAQCNRHYYAGLEKNANI